MNKSVLQNMLDKNPTLTVEGFAGDDAARKAFFTDENLSAFDMCCQFLREAEIMPNLRGKNSSVSYALKDIVQEWAKAKGTLISIPEGVLIAAALSLETEKKLIIKPLKNSVGAALNVKRASGA